MTRFLLNPLMLLGNKVSLTITPYPESSVVSFSTGVVVGNTTKVKPGTLVTYTVSCAGLETITGAIVVTQDILLEIDMHYGSGTVLLESSSAGTYDLPSRIIDVYCNIICVGGGGGGAGRLLVGTVAAGAGGGSGGYSNTNLILPTSVTQAIVGAAGGSSTSQGAGTSTGGSGGTSSVGSLVTATGGGGGYVRAQNSSPTTTGGSAGTGTTSNGNAGGTKVVPKNGTSGYASGGAAVYGSYGRGAAINVYTGSAPSVRTAPTAGYVKVTTAIQTDYLFAVSPEPQAVVVLLTNGHTQTGNSIRVDVGQNVSCLVYKNGFWPFEQTFQISADTVITLALKPKQEQISILDMGELFSVDAVHDAGSISGQVGITQNAGAITGTVSTTKDAGAIMSLAPVDEILEMGLVTENVTQTIDCEKIM